MQLLSGDEINGKNSEEKLSSVLPTGLVSQETLTLLNSLGKGSIDDKLKRILNEKREQIEQIIKLKSELDEEKTRLRTLEKQIPKFNDTQNINNSIDSEQQKQLSKEIIDLKNRLQRLEADNGSLQQEVNYRKKEIFIFYFCLLIRINDMMHNLKDINNKQMMRNELKKILNKNEDDYNER
jgi:DNA repair exonuclease SbcCD ATPase subunit